MWTRDEKIYGLLLAKVIHSRYSGWIATRLDIKQYDLMQLKRICVLDGGLLFRCPPSKQTFPCGFSNEIIAWTWSCSLQQKQRSCLRRLNCILRPFSWTPDKSLSGTIFDAWVQNFRSYADNGWWCLLLLLLLFSQFSFVLPRKGYENARAVIF